MTSKNAEGEIKQPLFPISVRPMGQKDIKHSIMVTQEEMDVINQYYHDITSDNPKTTIFIYDKFLGLPIILRLDKDYLDVIDDINRILLEHARQ